MSLDNMHLIDIIAIITAAFSLTSLMLIFNIRRK